MKMAKASEKDIDAAGKAMGVLDDISRGYIPYQDDNEDGPYDFDEDDPAHLRRFYDAMTATLNASPGWPGRVIGGMCYVILYPANKIVDPEADCLDLHPEHEANAKDAARYRWLRQFLAVDDVGDEQAIYGLVVHSDAIEETAQRAKCWADGAAGTVDRAIDAAIEAACAAAKEDQRG